MSHVVEELQAKYAEMLDSAVTRLRAEAIASTIAIEVQHGVRGSVTWKELGFTQADVDQRVHLSLVRELKAKYTAMADTATLILEVVHMARSILNKVWDGCVTWKELGCTQDDVEDRLAQAKRRAIAKDENAKYYVWSDERYLL